MLKWQPLDLPNSRERSSTFQKLHLVTMKADPKSRNWHKQSSKFHEAAGLPTLSLQAPAETGGSRSLTTSNASTRDCYPHFTYTRPLHNLTCRSATTPVTLRWQPKALQGRHLHGLGVWFLDWSGQAEAAAAAKNCKRERDGIRARSGFLPGGKVLLAMGSDLPQALRLWPSLPHARPHEHNCPAPCAALHNHNRDSGQSNGVLWRHTTMVPITALWGIPKYPTVSQFCFHVYPRKMRNFCKTEAWQWQK